MTGNFKLPMGAGVKASALCLVGVADVWRIVPLDGRIAHLRDRVARVPLGTTALTLNLN